MSEYELEKSNLDMLYKARDLVWVQHLVLNQRIEDAEHLVKKLELKH